VPLKTLLQKNETLKKERYRNLKSFLDGLPLPNQETSVCYRSKNRFLHMSENRIILDAGEGLFNSLAKGFRKHLRGERYYSIARIRGSMSDLGVFLLMQSPIRIVGRWSGHQNIDSTTTSTITIQPTDLRSFRFFQKFGHPRLMGQCNDIVVNPHD
jgi:hypothetical protein